MKKHLDLDKIQFILLGHLSPRTNDPDLIKKQITKTLGSFKKFKFAPTSKPITIK